MSNKLSNRFSGKVNLIQTHNIYLGTNKSVVDSEILITYSGYVTYKGKVIEQSFLKEQFHLLGKNFLKEIDGAFFMLIVTPKECLILRDGAGRRTGYYYLDKKGDFYFSNEPKSIYSLHHFEKEIEPSSLYKYLTFSFVPGKETMLKGIFELRPGEIVGYKNRKISSSFYYDVSDELKKEEQTESYWNKQITSAIDEEIKAGLSLSKSAGVFLSGGLDSSIITSCVSKLSDSTIPTYSIHFGKKYRSELEFARLVAKKYKTDHQEFILSNDDLFESLNSFLDYVDEPFADSSAIAVNTLCKRTKEQVTVALSGDGADELFAGYNKYQGEYRIQNPSFSETIVKGFHPLWKALPKSRNSVFGNTVRKLHKFSHGSSLNKKSRYIEWCSLGSEAFVKKLLCNYSSKQDLIKGVTKLINSSNGINDILANDIELVLTNDMLTKVDLMSMANSLEVRVPFLDHKIVEFANSLPESYKINRSKKKRILQDAFRNELPNELYNRPKHGFEVPLLDWLKTDLNDRIVNDYLSIPFIKEQGIFEPLEVQKLIKKLHSSNPEDSHANVWALIVFQHWYKTVILD